MIATKRRVRDMLVRLKTPVEIQDTEFYKRLTIRINHQGVSVRDTEIGAKIGTKSQFRVRAGDFILSKIDARQGAFGIVPPEADDGIITGNFWTFRVDNQLVDTDWFLQFTNSDAFLDLCKRSSTGNTHRKYLNEAIFLNHELTIPSLEEQRKAVASCKSGNKRVEEIQHEFTHQQSLLAKLKQAILQEAIQGKLTADWRAAHPDVEPASQLLQRIQTEKARLIAAKKLRPEKPLPKITDEEIPFEIPKGWEWCRLGNILSFSSGDGLIAAQMAGGDVPVFGGNGINGYHDKPNIETETIVVGRVGANCGAVHKTPARAWVTDNAFITTFSESCLTMDFLVLLLRFLNLNHLSYDGSQPVISGKRVYPLPTPLPPLAEQAAIVERVEALMTTCRALETEIEQFRAHAAHLLQAVLKEAFAPAS
jgi:type I restriction enzyme S subunit